MMEAVIDDLRRSYMYLASYSKSYTESTTPPNKQKNENKRCLKNENMTIITDEKKKKTNVDMRDAEQ